jgi:hypothetical protein
VIYWLFAELLLLRWRWLVWIHLPAAIAGAVLALGGWFWPFTGMEVWLRTRGASQGYTRNLVVQYLPWWLHPASLPRPMEFVAGLLVLALNAYIYRRVLREWRARRATAG